MVLNFDGTSTLWVLQRIFATLGLPVELETDYENSFITSEFWEFLKSNGIKHTFIPPYRKSSTGQAGLTLCTNCEKWKGHNIVIFTIIFKIIQPLYLMTVKTTA